VVFIAAGTVASVVWLVLFAAYAAVVPGALGGDTGEPTLKGPSSTSLFFGAIPALLGIFLVVLLVQVGLIPSSRIRVLLVQAPTTCSIFD